MFFKVFILYILTSLSVLLKRKIGYKAMLMCCIIVNHIVIYAEVRGYRYGWESQDSMSTIDSSLPMSKRYVPSEQPRSHITRQSDKHDPLIDAKMKDVTSEEKSIHTIEKHDEQERISDIDSRIHEIEKESYMLESHLFYKEKEKKDWSFNPNRSGYYIGLGFIMDFASPTNASLGISVHHINYAALFKVGYLRYYYNNFGLKGEVFATIGNGVTNNGPLVQQYGVRFSILQDISVFHPQNYFGLIVGVGFGGYKMGDIAWQLGLQAHFGVSWSFTKHHRVEIERIFLTPVDSVNYQATYAISYSWIF